MSFFHLLSLKLKLGMCEFHEDRGVWFSFFFSFYAQLYPQVLDKQLLNESVNRRAAPAPRVCIDSLLFLQCLLFLLS